MNKELRFITKNKYKAQEFQSLFANTQCNIIQAAVAIEEIQPSRLGTMTLIREMRLHFILADVKPQPVTFSGSYIRIPRNATQIGDAKLSHAAA